ncbi:efflux RND transporter periplasmic adaptor subunit [Marivita sp. S0852]|uniref:efflux RND transporter periplasmic adaptor subunit n=1 Tax=Marivita sp. S0852 TaxID=3373893 RepID=UPI00398213AF
MTETSTDQSNKAAPDSNERSTSPRTLDFQSDTGASGPVWLAAGLVVAIVLWMGSGFVFPTDTTEEVPARADPAPVSVAVTPSTAEEVTQIFRAEGQALADRDTMLRSETSGTIVEVLVSKGEDVAANAVIARFDPSTNQADARRAAEELNRAQREFDNAQALLDRGIATADRVAQARATLAAAQAQVAAVEQAADNLTIAAPFAGRVETLDLDVGEFVSTGTEVGRLVDITPLTVAIQVPQQSLTRLAVGQTATVTFITGETRDGTVSFIGTAAAAETRTFLAEIEVANEDGAIPAGISAEVVIPTNDVTAHFIPSSIVSLDPDGTLGVKTVTSDDVVEFHPIDIVRAQIDGIWVTGLPDTVDMITVGQGYVSAGETVAPRPEVAEQ